MDRFRFFPPMVHAIADYLGGLLLLFAPNLFGFTDASDAAVWIPRILGAMFITMALLTRNELGVIKLIPMPAHLALDYVASLFLAVSPFVFGFSGEPPNVWVPHVAVGLAYFVIALLTRVEPVAEHTGANHRPI